ncbi:MAG: hypothetical protein QM708_08885 [Propioniciclava sp.]|uniref:hypothetical protein n=1 Tax=Propioniciclava sp. TaxID=2038686 RepID=UPI0039E56A3A
MNTEKNTPKKRSYWGRSRFGGSSRALIVTCLVAGAVLALLFALLITFLQTGPALDGVLFVISAIVMLPVSAMIVWIALIDRTTLTDAPDDPESSIEGQWLDRAGATSFNHLFAIIGLGAGVFSFIEVAIPTQYVLLGLALIALADFGLQYQLIKRKER